MKSSVVSVLAVFVGLAASGATDGSRTVQTRWFDGGVAEGWPAAPTMFGGDWREGAAVAYADGGLVLGEEDEVNFDAAEAKPVVSNDVEIIAEFVPSFFDREEDLPAVPEGARAGVAVVTGAFYVVACDDFDTYSNSWKRLGLKSGSDPVDLAAPIAVSVRFEDFSTLAPDFDSDRLMTVYYRVNGTPLVEPGFISVDEEKLPWEYEDQLTALPPPEGEPRKSVSFVQLSGPCELTALNGYADALEEGAGVMCRVTHEGATSDYLELADAMKVAVRGDVVTLVGNAAGRVITLKPGVSVAFEDGASAPVWTAPELYRLVTDGDLVVGVELDPARVTPLIAATPDRTGFELGETTVSIAATDVKAGLYYAVVSASTIEGLDTATPGGWVRAASDGPIVFDAVPRSGSTRFYRVVVTDAPATGN